MSRLGYKADGFNLDDDEEEDGCESLSYRAGGRD